ncbi:ankyrin repeat domain-containing protein [Flavobacterium psychrotrophum]|uniref:ankyrin repeat domain-containing protein n=1 Tax=Flavobacterium psychrotrophum TaxID=2294119 RepID=UPI000E30DA7F|nr:ankyrin repeat domain-containing protein [Flavobacterium psychrotrophum]
MKKTIIYVSFALVALFSNSAVANASTVLNFGLVTEYKNATPLAVAIVKGDIETVKKFIEYGADINEKSNGLTPLMLAARYNQVAIIGLLLEKGAQIKATDDKGNTALKYAQLSNATDAVTVLKKALEA